MREVVVQLGENLMISDKSKGTFGALDPEKCCEPLKKSKFLKKWNGAKININYITKNIDEDTQEIHPLFFDILKNTRVVKYKKEYFLEFKTYTDLFHFKLFKSFKGLNSAIFDNEQKNIKLALKTYKESENFKRVNFNLKKHSHLGLNLNSLILEDSYGVQIYSNRDIFEIEDFFVYDNKQMNLKSYDDFYNSVIHKLESNKVFLYAKSKNDDVYKTLISSVENTINELYEKYNEIYASISRSTNLSNEAFELFNKNSKDPLLKRVVTKKQTSEEKQTEKNEFMNELQKEQNIEVKNIKKAFQMGNKIKHKLIKIASDEGLSVSEIEEDFPSIFEDIAIRHPQSCDNEKMFIEAFLEEM